MVCVNVGTTLSTHIGKLSARNKTSVSNIFWEVLHVSQWRWWCCSSSGNGNRQYFSRAFYILIAYHVNKQQLRWNIQMPSFSFCIVVSLYCQIPQGDLIIWTRSCKHGAVCRMPLDWRDGSCVVLEHCYCYTTGRKKLNEYRIVLMHKSCVRIRTKNDLWTRKQKFWGALRTQKCFKIVDMAQKNATKRKIAKSVKQSSSIPCVLRWLDLQILHVWTVNHTLPQRQKDW